MQTCRKTSTYLHNVQRAINGRSVPADLLEVGLPRLGVAGQYHRAPGNAATPRRAGGGSGGDGQGESRRGVVGRVHTSGEMDQLHMLVRNLADGTDSWDQALL